MRPTVLSVLKEATKDYFDTIRSLPALHYDRFAGLVRRGDTVITFNYDLGVERALQLARLWDIKTGYGFAIQNGAPPSTVEVLKLHGSTNWRALLFGGRTGFFSIGNSLGDRPVLCFQLDLEYLGYRDFFDPLCPPLGTAASLPAMIMPALPKHFYFATTFGGEWKGFWDRLWQRAENAIENADELVVIGYSLPTADERARAMLLDTANKAVRLSICCGKATASLEQEFRNHGFSCIDAVMPPTFDGFLTRKTVEGSVSSEALTSHKTPAGMDIDIAWRLEQLIGKHCFYIDVRCTILSIEPPTRFRPELLLDQMQAAINQSLFTVRYEGVLIDGSDTGVISGLDIASIEGRY
jgi:hypothetical protein